MKVISLKLPEDELNAATQFAGVLRVSRMRYIRRAVVQMNEEMAAQVQAKRLAEASRKVRKQSMRVNAEFAAIERDPDA